MGTVGSVPDWYVGYSCLYGGISLLVLSLYPVYFLMKNLSGDIGRDFPRWRLIAMLLSAGLILCELLIIIEGIVILTEFRKNMSANGAGLVTCRICSAFVDWINGSMFAGYLYFYFARIQITFQGTSLKISTLAERSFQCFCAVILSLSIISGIFRGIYSVVPYSELKGYYCFLEGTTTVEIYLGIWYAFTALFIGCSLCLGYLYISRLRNVLTEAVERLDDKIVFLLRKNALLCLTCSASSAIVMTINAGIWTWILDLFINYVLLVCSFKFSNDFFRVLFFPCMSCLELDLNLEERMQQIANEVGSIGSSGLTHLGTLRSLSPSMRTSGEINDSKLGSAGCSTPRPIDNEQESTMMPAPQPSADVEPSIGGE